MFHISRALYRELSADLVSDRDREHVLRACEATVERLVCDRFYFAHPARTLFADVRWRFPLHAQTRVHAVIERHLTHTLRELESSLGATLELTGRPLRCRATTRRGVPCTHDPDPRTGYCSWHRHLADDAVAAA